MHTQEGVRGDARGADVEGVALALGNPVLVDAHQLLNGLQMHLRIDGLRVKLVLQWQREDKDARSTCSYGERSPWDGTCAHGPRCRGRPSCPRSTSAFSEDGNTYFRRVVENGRRGIQGQVVVGNDAGRAPLRSVEVDFEHVVGHVLAKTELLVWHLRFGSLRALDDNVGLLRVRELDSRLPRRRRIGQGRSSLSIIRLQKRILLIILVAAREKAILDKESMANPPHYSAVSFMSGMQAQ